MSIRILLITLLLSGSFSLFSQSDYRPGFIITLKSDTVPGFILYKENISRFSTCSYRRELDGEEINYDPFQLSGYGFQNDRYYVSREVTMDSVYGNYFAEVLVQGRATLLKINFRFFLEDHEGTLYELAVKTIEIINDKGRFVRDNELYKGILNWKFSDCKKIYSKIKSLTLGDQALIELFDQYNSCFGAEQKTVKNKSSKPWSEIHIGLSGGLYSSTLYSLDNLYYYNNINPDQFKKDMGLFGGLSMIFSFPRLSERLNFNVDLFYKRGSHESLQERPNSYETMYLEYSALQTPVSFGYLFNNSRLKIKPNIEVGANFEFTLNSTSFWQVDYILGNTVTTEKRTDIVSMKKIAFSPFIGIGAYKKFGEKFQAFTRFRYLYGVSNIDDSLLVVPQQSINFTIGIIIKVTK